MKTRILPWDSESASYIYQLHLCFYKEAEVDLAVNLFTKAYGKEPRTIQNITVSQKYIISHVSIEHFK